MRRERMVHNSRAMMGWHTRSPWGNDADDAVPPSEPTPGDPLRSAVAGAVAGLAGSWVALALAEAVEDRARLGEYVRIAIGSGSVTVTTASTAVWLVILFASLAGMLGGAGLGWLMRRLHGLVGRALFGAVLVPSVFIAVDAFGLLRLVPRDGAPVPFVPWLLAAVAYGVCVAMVRPVVPAAAPPEPDTLPYLDDVSTFDPPSGASGNASFLLLRRK